MCGASYVPNLLNAFWAIVKDSFDIITGKSQYCVSTGEYKGALGAYWNENGKITSASFLFHLMSLISYEINVIEVWEPCN